MKHRAADHQYEPCEECGSPLDPQQRYCVNCAARRSNGANPSSRYFAAMSKRARRPPARPPAKAGSNSRAAAVGFFALLPIAVAIGVLVGRADSGNGDEGALLQALREQNSGSVASTAAAGATGTSKGKADKAKAGPKEGWQTARKGRRQDQERDRPRGDGLQGNPEGGPKEDTKLVENNVKQSGSTYIEGSAAPARRDPCRW